MKNKITRFLALLTICLTPFSLISCNNKEYKIYEKYSSYFKIGAAFSKIACDMYDDNLSNEFNSMTCENEMKWEYLQPSEGEFNFLEADEMVEFAKKHNMKVRGHALVWHNACPQYVFDTLDETTNKIRARTKDELKEVMRNHIRTVISHFKDDYVYAWDVVNEAINDETEEGKEDRSNIYRGSDWYKILGEDYIVLAFKYAKEIVEEENLNVKLYYNDYDLANPIKRDKALLMLNHLLEEGAPIDGIGMQSHYHLGSFSMEYFEEAIKAYSNLGLDIQITEFDVNVYDRTKTYIDWYDFELPESIEKIQATIYGRAFEILRKYKDNISSVSFWGVADDLTYMDNDITLPSNGHKNYPYIFDIDHNKKLSYYEIMDF